MTNHELFKLDSSISQALPFLISEVSPTPLKHAELLTYSKQCAELLGLSPEFCESNLHREIASGEYLPEGGLYYAQVYAGHQFGQYVPQLGDGRAISLGSFRNKDGKMFELQLKGSGKTPYSRMGDGRAVLRSCIREYLASEAMAALGIPTTRALNLIGSKEWVYRERAEIGAMMTRVAPSHIRFGHFEYLFHQGKLAELQQLADHCLKHFYPKGLEQENPYAYLLEQVVIVTAQLIAQWQAQGFAHGVMNTDNMSILGLTIDYGPYGFLDDYDPSFVCNHSDHYGRYAFDQQPSIGLWNLNALALTFSHWLSSDEIKSALALYEPQLVESYVVLMQQKLGFDTWGEKEHAILSQLLTIMSEQKADYSQTFRRLNTVSAEDESNENNTALLALFKAPESMEKWLVQYRNRLSENEMARHLSVQQQDQINPAYVLRNYLAQIAIQQAEKGELEELECLFTLLSTPFEEKAGFGAYSEPSPSWGKELEISCSS